jgi:putative MATE family efflux protein
MSGKHSIDMTEGPLFGKIVRYVLPLTATYMMQHLFHFADIMVIGRFASHESMAAIGTTGDLNGMMLILIWGIATGANVVVAQCYGAGDRKALAHAVHSAMALAFTLGTLVFFLGMIFARSLLLGIDVPPEVIDKSCLYWRICFFGTPFMLVYNYACAVLRALGDTRRPLYLLTLGGVVNVLLNLVFVIVFHMDVAGVALATALSQMLSGLLMLRLMLRSTGPERIMLRHVRFYWPQVRRMLYIGIPSGMNGLCWTFPNVLIQRSINSLGAYAMAGSIVSCQLEGVLYVIVIAVYQTAMSFAGQNYGAKRYDRVRRSVLICLGVICSINAVGGWLCLAWGRELLRMIKPDALVVEQGFERLSITMSTYFILGAMDTFSGGLRGIGRSISPLVVTFLGACVYRIIWIWAVFPRYRTLGSLLMTYPVSWSFISAVNGAMFFIIVKRLIDRGEHRTIGRRA